LAIGHSFASVACFAPPELVAILRAHIETFGVASDGRIFSSERGQPVASTAISDVWAEARTLALAPAQVASPWLAAPTTCATPQECYRLSSATPTGIFRISRVCIPYFRYAATASPFKGRPRSAVGT
jgi:hypothetical protein